MWSSAHAAVGGAILVTIPDPVVGGGLAFISHFVLDYIGESRYRDLNEAAFMEGTLLTLYVITAAITGHFWLLMYAWVMANLPDLIDKPRRLIWGKKEWFSCHNGKGLFQFNGWKFGYPVKYPIGYNATIMANMVSTALFIAYALSRFV